MTTTSLVLTEMDARMLREQLDNALTALGGEYRGEARGSNGTELKIQRLRDGKGELTLLGIEIKRWEV